MSYRVKFSCISHMGNCRKINQDNFICNNKYMEINNNEFKFPLHGYLLSKDMPIFGVFDGMGGEECGEVAAYIAAKEALKIVSNKNTASVLNNYCKSTNEEICKYSEKNSIGSMGTTAAILAFTKREIYLCNIGDSKIFRFSKGILKQISKDHISIAAFGEKPPLSQNLGIPDTELIIEPYIARGNYNNHDVYLICTDGLTDMVGTEEIKKIISEAPYEKISEMLLNRALENGGKDNITVITCEIEYGFYW